MTKKKIQEENEEIKETQEEKKTTKPKYPKIIGGICEFCGKPAKECMHYKNIFAEGKFTTITGSERNPASFKQLIYMYVPKWKIWIDNSDASRKQVELRGGYTEPEIMRFFNP